MNKLERLRSILLQIGRGVVAFSGGCDSAFLLRVAYDVLGDNVVALTAVSPSMPPWEREEAQLLCQHIGAEQIWVESREFEREEYRANPANRCFYCKDELFSIACREAMRLQLGVVMDGNNFDDRSDHRPGREAAIQHGVRSPLDEAELTKSDIRHYSKLLGLPSWDKPAIACLASRFPYGIEITHERIERVMACEKILRDLGFRQFRARFHDTILRIEIAPDEFSSIMAPDMRNHIVAQCKDQGFTYVALDLQGYRCGSLNETLKTTVPLAAVSKDI